MAKHYDYIFAGTGMAAFSLVCRMIDDPFFADKRLLLIDREAKKGNDRTWSFWEKEPGYFNDIVYKSWNRAMVRTASWEKSLHLEPYQYKVIRSEEFYVHAWQKIDKAHNITFLQTSIENVDEENAALITVDGVFTAEFILNSLFSLKDLMPSNNRPLLLQHFKGYVIKTERQFDDTQVTFMDFSIPQENTMQFMYVLPYDAQTCLVEHTYFSKHFVEESVYDRTIQNYCDKHFGIGSWTIKEVEKGVIPMTSISFPSSDSPKIISIGTRGGYTKASSGYTFHFVQKEAETILSHLKSGKPYRKANTRFNFYDALLLRVLDADEGFGHELFSKLFSNHQPQTVFAFLNEESSISQELSIIVKSPHWRFIKSLFSEITA